MVFKPCVYLCGAKVEVRKILSEKTGEMVWRPFEENGNMHNCPNSPYNKKQREKQVENMYSPPPPSEQELQHPEVAVIEVKDAPRYPQHRVTIVASSDLTDLQDKINEATAANDQQGYNHRGVTLLLDDLVSHEYSYIACIHYEILMPKEQRK